MSRNARRSPLRFLVRLGALAGTAVAVSVCGSQDRFNSGGSTGPTGDLLNPSVRIAPTDTLGAALSGMQIDSLNLTISASDETKLQTFSYTIRGLGSLADSVLIAWDTTFTAARTTFTKPIPSLRLPMRAAGQRLVVTASATDGGGNIAPTRTDTVYIVDTHGPTTAIVRPPGDVTSYTGSTVWVTARASDSSGIKYLGARLKRVGQVPPIAADSLVYPTRLTTKADSFRIVIPATLAPGDYILQAFAADSSTAPGFNTSVSSTSERRLTVRDTLPPVVTVQSPLGDSSVSAGDSVLVRFRVQDNSGVVKVKVEGVALRGDSSLGNDQFVNRFVAKPITLGASPRDTTLRRYLNVDPSTDRRAEPVFLRVWAWDSPTDSTVAVLRIQMVAGASVQVDAPAAGLIAPVGNPLAITLRGSDPDGIKMLGYASTGAIALRDSSVFAAPLLTARSAALSLALPGTAALGVDTITPFMIDGLGNRTLGTPVGIAFADSTAPLVTFVSPLAGSAVPAGTDVPVQIRVRDNRPGTSVSVLGRSVRSVSGQTVTVARFAPVGVAGLNSIDTTVARTLPAILTDSTGENVYLVATATDAVGNRQTDSILVRVTAVSGPFVRIDQPASGAQIRLATRDGVRILPLISAFHPDTITYLGYQATGRITQTDSMAATRPMVSTFIAQELDILVRDTTRLGTITLTPFARTKLGLRFTGPAISIELIDGSLPVVNILSPARTGTDSVPAGDSLFVRVAASDDRQLASLKIEGFSRSPDVAANPLGYPAIVRFTAKNIDLTVPTLQVRDTVSRYLIAVPTDSTVVNNAFVVATATDAAGNVGVDTVYFRVRRGAFARVVSPAAGASVSVGSPLAFTVRGFDWRGLGYIGYQLSGALALRDSLVVGTPTDSVSQAFSVATTATTPLESVAILPFGRRADGSLIVGAPVSVNITDPDAPLVSLFSKPVTDTAITSGDSVLVRVRVRDNRGVVSVNLRGVARRGVDSLGTVQLEPRFTAQSIAMPPSLDATVTRYLMPVSSDSSAEPVWIMADVADAAGNVRRDSVRIQLSAGPFVRVNAPAAGLQHPVGTTLNVTVQGYDTRNLTYVGYVARGVLGQADSVAVSPAAASATRTLAWAVPATAALGVDTLVPFARNAAGSRFYGAPVLISFVDAVPPTVTMQGPLLDTAVSAGDSVLMQVRVQDNRGVVRVKIEGVALRGDSSLGTNQFVDRFTLKEFDLASATDATLRRHLNALTTDLRAEPVFIRVTATDSAGNTASALRRFQVVTGASVRLVAPAAGLISPVGNPLAITLSGFDPDSVKVLGYASSGAIGARDSSVLASPLGTTRSAALSLPVPSATSLGADTLTPFVISGLGRRTVGAPVVVTFADSANPQVSFASPLADTGIVAGTNVVVSVRVRDNRVGTSVSLLGRTQRSVGGQLTTVARFTPVGIGALNSLDTTVTRTLVFTGDSTAELVYLVATVTDGIGNRFSDSIRVQITAGPYVRIAEPANGTQIRLGQTGARILPEVEAFRPDTIAYVGVRVTGRVTTEDSVASPRPMTTTRMAQQIAINIPANAPLGTITLTPFVRTKAGTLWTGPWVSYELIDGSLPVVSILAPTHAGTFQVPAGDSVLVRVAASDDRQLASLTLAGFARRPDVWPDSLGQVSVVERFASKLVNLAGTVHDTVVRYLLPVPSDSTVENVYIVATAVDAVGNTSVDTVKVVGIAGPRVSLTAPAAGLRHAVGTTLSVTVSGTDPHNLTWVGFEARGVLARADSLVVSPAAGASTQTLAWAVPATAVLGVDTLVPFARNAVGGRFYGAPVVISLADVVAPAISILGPALDSAVGVGDSVRVRVQVTDLRGVARIEMDGVQLQGDSSLGTATLLTRLVLRTDTLPQPTTVTLTRYLNAVQGQTGLGAIFIRAIATDSSGNSTTAWRRINLVAGPYVQITVPTAPAVQPIGATVNVAIRAYDADGVRRVGFLATGAVSGGDSATYSTPLPTTKTDTLTLTIPATARGSLSITPFSVDSLGNRLIGVALPVTLSDTAKPTVTIDTPAVALYPVGNGDSVYVRVGVADNMGVTRVTLTGVAQRGSVALGTDTTVTRFLSKTVLLPSQTSASITRYLLPDLTQSASEVVYIIVTAEDSAGNVASDTVTVRVVGGPVMTVVRPAAGATTSAGKSVVVEMRGVDANGVRMIGWRATGVVVGQDSAFFSPVSGSLADTATFVDTLPIPGGTPLGTFTLTPFGTDSIGDVSGTVAGVTVTVQSSAGDATGPALTFRVGRRIEVDDSVTVTATDPSGIRNLGFRVTKLDGTVLAFDSLAANLGGTLSDVTRTFSMNLPSSLRYPSQVVVSGYATDNVGVLGNSGFSVVAETLTVVAGKTYALPAGALIADAIYNARRRELYLASYTQDRIEVFSLASNSIVASIPVGSRPWGLAMWPRATSANAADTLYGDTLIVANSGGTNLSIVDVSARREVRRHQLPNYSVEKIKSVSNTAGGTNLEITAYDFSDRPQHVAAVCRAGSLTACDSVIAVYSTTPTGGQSTPYQGRGYLAWENLTQTGTPSGKGHLFWEQADVQPAGSQDTIQILSTMYDGAGGTAVDTIVGAGAGKILDLQRLVFQDTTYVRSSGNFLRVLVGEGGGGLTLARVLAYDGSIGRSTTNAGLSILLAGYSLSRAVQRDNGITAAALVQDFIGNRASSVTAVAMNFNGSTNLVRADSIYVFDNTLRQSGMLQVSGAAHGMDVAPLHAFSATARGTNTVPGDGDADARIVFAARPDSSIDVFDTYFFGEVTDTLVASVPIPIRNALVGAVRVTPDGGGTVLVGVTNSGLTVVRLPALTNPFMAPSMRPEIALPERRVTPKRGGATSPPLE